MSEHEHEPDDDEGFAELANGEATYCPEDNKLRIYPGGTRIDSILDAAEYSAFKAAGYKWAAKQECFVCPRWTPTAEDWAIRLCGEIGDEDYSPEERAADRAERFGGYRDKRAGEAGGHADAFEAGPSAFGHQSRARAERQAARHDRHRVRAVDRWSKAEYWQMRTAGVIRHARYKSSAPVRRERFKRLETEQRKHLQGVEEAQSRYDAWKAVAAMDGADIVLPENLQEMNEAQRRAYELANTFSYLHFWHPTDKAANDKVREVWKHGFGTYDLLTSSDFCGVPMRQLTPREVAEVYLAAVRDPSTRDDRWARHYELRLSYEKAMLENEGGMAADVEMEPGGWIGSHQIHKVNKSSATGRVVSVSVMAPHPWRTNKDGSPVVCLRPVNIERLGTSAYRAPTAEELAEFSATKKAAKDAAKATRPKEPPTINPTDADAERLQQLLNKANRDDRQILHMTQAEYSRNSRGSYAACEIRTLHADGRVSSESSNLWTSSRAKLAEELAKIPKACKLRLRYGRVIVLTDKPQKPIPINWEKLDKSEAEPTPETKQEPKPEPVKAPAGQLFDLAELVAEIAD